MNTVMQSRVHISIGFGDAILPVVRGEDGHDRVPLKPICDEIGVNWRNQRRKLEGESYLSRRIGAKVEGVNTLSHPMICIRMDRVEAFLNTLNPENLRGMGNDQAAAWLEAKHAEWDYVLHAYEQAGGKAAASAAVSDVAKLIAAREHTANPAERAALTVLLHRALAAQGAPVPENPQTRLQLVEGKA